MKSLISAHEIESSLKRLLSKFTLYAASEDG